MEIMQFQHQSEEKVNEIIIKTSKPVTEGNIEIVVEKAILGNQEYTKEQMQEFKEMTLGVMTDNKTKETQQTHTH